MLDSHAILDRYQFRWYPTLNQASKMCDTLNRGRDEQKQDLLYT